MVKGRSPISIKKHSNASPRVRHRESPPRQLQLELDRTFAQLQIYDNERQQLHAYNRKSLQDELDARELAQAIAHKAEIEDAIAKHEAVRQQAVAVLEAHIRDEEERRRQLEEEDRRRREEEAHRKAEEQRLITEEQEKKAREERQRVEALRHAAAEKARVKQEESERREREAAAEQQRQSKVKAEQQAAAEAEALQKKEEARAAASKPQRTPPSGSTTADASLWSTNPETRHRQYLDIHKKLKVFRKDFWAHTRKDPTLKPHVGEMRRAIKLAVGQQTTDDKVANSRATKRVKDVFLKAIKEVPSNPMVVNDYLPAHLGLLDKNTTTVPALVLYLLSMFSKAIVMAFTNECAGNPKAAEPLGTMVAQIFSMQDLQFKRNVPSAASGIHYSAFGGSVPTPPMAPDSVSLISVLMSKFHAVAPIIFGIGGSEETTAGKLRLGWRREYAVDGDTEKSFLSAAKHHSRMGGLGAGYASVALRNFSKTTLTNPWPPYHFWESVSFIANTRSADIQPTHCYLLKSMLENSLDRILQFFGDEGVALLRVALIDFPKRLPPELKQHNAGIAISFLAGTLTDQCNFRLER